jgi:hypothetical protein
MPIRLFLKQGHGFDDEAVRDMGLAYEFARSELRIIGENKLNGAIRPRLLNSRAPANAIPTSCATSRSMGYFSPPRKQRMNNASCPCFSRLASRREGINDFSNWQIVLQKSPSELCEIEICNNRIGAPNSFLVIHRAEITSLAARYGLPAAYPFRSFTELGGLLSYGIDPIDSFRRAATYADRILKGATPSELPVQAPVKFELVINLKTAKALGLNVPLHLQQRADEVIE